MKYAIIENSRVVNIAASDTPLASNWIDVGTAKIGDTWDGSVFTTPGVPLGVRMSAASDECSRRIYDVAPQTTQMNLSSVAGAGMLPPEDLTTWQSALVWVGLMRGTWRNLAATGADISDDTNWPELPLGVADLVDKY